MTERRLGMGICNKCGSTCDIVIHDGLPILGTEWLPKCPDPQCASTDTRYATCSELIANGMDDDYALELTGGD